jgi:predicted ATP-grasp superfamily ATP-dependent carboligase
LHLEVLQSIERIGNCLAARFELIGLFGVDMVVQENRVWTVEANPRYSSSVEIVERATGVAALALHTAACSHASLAMLPVHHCDALVHGKAILFAKRPLTISGSFAEWSLAESVKTSWPTIADVSPAGTQIDAGRPIMTVFAEAAEPEQVECRLRERIADIEAQVYSD